MTVTVMIPVTPMVAVTITATAMTTVKLTVAVDRTATATNGNAVSLTSRGVLRSSHLGNAHVAVEAGGASAE